MSIPPPESPLPRWVLGRSSRLRDVVLIVVGAALILYASRDTNHAPALTNIEIDAENPAVGQLVRLNFLATDPDGDQLMFEMAN